ncbi:MAG: DUF4442 domain-containing protein [Crocinitomicaceae bacterium]
MNLNQLILKAKTSKFQLWKLNRILWIGIPFNKPHRFKIRTIQEGHAVIDLPYRKSNLNHIKTIHACAMATCSEYVSGLVLGTKFDFKEFRLIMKNMHMEYHYQGKMNAYCEFNFSDEEFEKVKNELKSLDSIDIQVKVLCKDQSENILSTALITWQIKYWSKTKKKNLTSSF